MDRASKSSIAPLALAAALLGCDGKPAEPTAAPAAAPARPLSGQVFGAYLAYKRIPDQPGERRERARRTLEQQSAIADLIAATPLAREPQVEAELLDNRNRVLIERHLERHLEQAVSDQAVRQYYEAHGDELGELRARIAHIRVRPGLRPGDSEEAVNERLTRLAEELRHGADFAAYAREHSDDLATRDQGGEIGWIDGATAEPALVEAVARLSAGAVGAPVRTAQGLHLIKVLEGPARTVKPLETVAEAIRYRLRGELRAAELRRLREAAGFAAAAADE